MAEKKITRRLSLKLFSIILAIIAWLIITYLVDPTITYVVKNVPITFIGEDTLHEQGLTLIDRNSSDSISIKIRGPRSAVINAIDTVSARVDISDITSKGQKTENVDANIGISGVTLANRTRLIISLSVDDLIEKEVPVKIIQSGTEKNKQTIVASESEDGRITIKGARSELEKVSYALVSVDISGIDAQVSRPLSYTLVNAEESKVNCTTLIDPPTEIIVTSYVYARRSVAIKPVLIEKAQSTAVLNIKSLSKDNVDVGIMDETADISEIHAVFDPSVYREGQEEYTLRLLVPDGVYLSEGAQTVTAKLSIEKKIEKAVTLSIEVRGTSAPAALTQSTISLMLRGAESDLNADKVKAYVDASRLSDGYHELNVQLDTAADVTLAEPVRVGINIG